LALIERSIGQARARRKRMFAPRATLALTPMPRSELSIPVAGAQVAEVAAVLDSPDAGSRTSAMLFAHGAGVDMLSPWMDSMARELVAHGFEVMRFRYPYMQRAQLEQRTLPPDRAPVLEATHEAALAELRRARPKKRVLLAGKSLGGRMGTLIAAKGADCAGLVLFGYPLHPPRQPDKERSEHFAALAQPALFLQGTRDEFGDPEQLRAALRRYGGRATLAVIEGGDHSFAVPKSMQRSLEATLAEIAARVDAWERATWPE
jgi:predicted alpha/beta-hydrolase family hydrolase